MTSFDIIIYPFKYLRMMIQNNLVSLDESLTYGDILGAVQRHFDKDVSIIFDKTEMKGKAFKLQSLANFLQTIKHVNKIQILANNVKKNETYSLLVFDFTNTKDEQLIWHEVIRRKWKYGLVIEEEYYLHPTEKQMEKCKSENGIMTSSDETTSPKKKATKSSSTEPRKSDAKPNATVKRRSNKAAPSELLKIHGIGPKICTKLNAQGIFTLKDLTRMDPDKLGQILASVGARYKNFDPSAWIDQAKKLSQ